MTRGTAQTPCNTQIQAPMDGGVNIDPPEDDAQNNKERINDGTRKRREPKDAENTASSTTKDVASKDVVVAQVSSTDSAIKQPIESPRKPKGSPTPIALTPRQYKTKYEEMKLRYVEYKKKRDQEVEQCRKREGLILTENKKLKEQMQELKLVVAENDSTEKENRTDFESLKTDYENAIAYKDQVILKQTKTIQECEEKLQKSCENPTENSRDWEKEIKEKEDEIIAMKEQMSNLEEAYKTNQLHQINSDDDLFRMKPKGKRNSKNAQLNCDFPDCESLNVDMIKCNICSKWVCEACNDVPVSKLKLIMDKCKTVYFICKACTGRSHVTVEKAGCTFSEIVDVTTLDQQEQINEKSQNNAALMQTIEKMLNKMACQLETKVEKLIDKKMEGKIDQVTCTGNTGGQTSSVVSDGASTERPMYSNVLTEPQVIRKILKETRYKEKIEEKEKEQRTNNFIIHGAEEIGDNNAAIKRNDEEYILDILDEIRIPSCKPKTITRLGKPDENKRRAIKVEMKTKGDKDKIMGNLKYLKGTEDMFGKLRITDDYTREEREVIREWAKKAEEKSLNDPNNTYRVRGDPKNGLRLVHFPK